jgi:hypothetical protein
MTSKANKTNIASAASAEDTSNPFSISHKKNISSPRRKSPSSVWSEEDINSKLQGYLEISDDLWTNVKYGSHIRYINKNNEFKTGGFVLKNPIELNKQSDSGKDASKDAGKDASKDAGKDAGKDTSIESKPAFLLQSNFDKSSSNYLTWFVQYSDIKKLYLKVDASVRLLVSSLELTIDGVNNNMKKISQYIKKIDARVSALEDYNKSR